MWSSTGWFASKKPSSRTPSPQQERTESIKEAIAEDSEPVHYTKSKAHHAGNGTFVNPWPSAKPNNVGGWIPSFQIPFAWAQVIHPSMKRIKVVEPDFEKEASSNEMKVTWLGHAGVLVQLPALKPAMKPISLLIDPIFSTRSSPSQYAGPARRLPSPCLVEDLPHIDFVFISHNHYDHLDFVTVNALVKRGGSLTRYVVPLGLGAWFKTLKVPEQQIIELDWWNDATFQPSQLGHTASTADKLGSIRVSCVPAQHNSARTGWDKGTSLWAGFVIEQFAYKPSKAPERTCVYFAGDTGYRANPKGPYCPAFEQIGEQFGPVDFSAIPIWRGGTLSFVASWGVRLHHEALTLATHATPDDAVCIHSDVKSKASLGMHFATFAGSEDEATYPIGLLEEACLDASIPMEVSRNNGFGVCDIGETVLVYVRPTT